MVTQEQIPFNKPFIAGKELFYLAQAVTFGNISGDGTFTKRCAELLERRFDVPKVLLTPSCTAALEMAAMLCDLQPGDEVIMPSFYGERIRPRGGETSLRRRSRGHAESR